MGYRRFQIGCEIVESDLLNATTFIKNLTYVRFGIILTQFYVNFSRQEHKIGIVENLKFSSFIPYPLSFFLYCSPFKYKYMYLYMNMISIVEQYIIIHVLHE